jgi:hypothetical protein
VLSHKAHFCGTLVLNPRTGGGTMRVALGTRLRTGEACTQTGIWRVLHVAASSTSVINGQAMPSYAGHSVIWELVDAL